MILELNEYVRTKNGIIAKVIGVQSGGIETYFFDKEVHNLFNYLNGLVVENVVLKHSFNIIDLIEEGDILKIKDVPYAAEYISEVFEDYENNLCVSDFEVEELRPIRKYVDENKIKIIAILTKEQFKAMEYEVK